MFCSKCGSKITDIASFCANCGAPVEKSVVPKRLTRNEWVNQGGNIEAAKEIKVMKILSYITIAILCILFSLVTVKYVIIYEKIKDAFGENVDFKAFFSTIIVNGKFLVLSVIFGILGVKKLRIGFSITYLILGDVSFLFSVGRLLGGGLHNLVITAVMSILFAIIIAMQVKINNKYKSAKKQL